MRMRLPIGRRPSSAWAVALAIAALGLPPAADAHFLWLTAERRQGEPVVLAFLSETPAPDLPTFMKSIESATYAAEGRPLRADRGEDTFVIRLDGETPWAVDGDCRLGLMSRDGATFRIAYTARVQFAPPAGDGDSPETGLRLRLVDAAGDGPAVQVTFDGEPAPGSEVSAFLEDGTTKALVADGDGRVSCDGLAEGKTALLVKWRDGIAGELDGKPFDETRHYATLTITPEEPGAISASVRPEGRDAAFAMAPQPINSFGGAVLGDWLYVDSGHTGTTHRYHTGTTNPHFYRLNLKDRTAWEELPCGPALQGLALVAHGGTLYRVGGMAARNEEGQPHDLASVADVSRFDPETRTWSPMPPLPEPRSTHDAAVLGDHLYVVGGWSMTGGDSADAFFLGDALRLDLSNPEADWERLPDPPSSRRALAVAAFDGKIYVVGGLTEAGTTVRDVDVFDPAASSWTKGPELPGPAIQGFAPSAFAVGGRLFASGGEGTVYRLATGGDAWEPVVSAAVPRITHRLLPGIDGDVLLVGGNFAGVPVRFIESVPAAGDDGPAPVVSWAAEVPGEALKSPAVGVVGGRVVVAGGNRSDEPHAFDAENLSGKAVRIRPDGTAAEPIAPLPAPRQSGVLVELAEGRGRVGYLLGGIGSDGETVRTLGEVFRLDPSVGSWTKLDATLPDDRGMFGAVAHEGSIWVFGGSIFDPRSGSHGMAFPTEVLRWEPGRDGGTFEPTGHQLPRARRSFAGAELDGRYVLVGGLGDDGEPVDAVDVFDFASGSWSTFPAPSQHRVFADLVALGGRLYLGGGFSRGPSGRFEPNPRVEVFDPAAGRWSMAMESAPVPASGLRMLALGGRLVFVGADPGAERRMQLAIAAPGSRRPEAEAAE